MGRLDGRVALLTGAGRGIGAATAAKLASEGAGLQGLTRTLSIEPGRFGINVNAVSDESSFVSGQIIYVAGGPEGSLTTVR